MIQSFSTDSEVCVRGGAHFICAYEAGSEPRASSPCASSSEDTPAADWLAHPVGVGLQNWRP